MMTVSPGALLSLAEQVLAESERSLDLGRMGLPHHQNTAHTQGAWVEPRT